MISRACISEPRDVLAEYLSLRSLLGSAASATGNQCQAAHDGLGSDDGDEWRCSVQARRKWERFGRLAVLWALLDPVEQQIVELQNTQVRTAPWRPVEATVKRPSPARFAHGYDDDACTELAREDARGNATSAVTVIRRRSVPESELKDHEFEEGVLDSPGPSSIRMTTRGEEFVRRAPPEPATVAEQKADGAVAEEGDLWSRIAARLTPHSTERAIVEERVARCWNLKEIAELLGLSVYQVRRKVESAYRKIRDATEEVRP